MVILLLFLIIALAYIGHQLYQTNGLKRAELSKVQEKEIQQDTDEYLKGKYPHLFLDFREELREHYGLLKRIGEKEKRASKTAKELESVSWLDLLGDDYDLDTNPNTMLRFWREENKDNKERLESLNKLEDNFKQIYQQTAKESFLTETELYFCSWKFWKTIFESGDYIVKELQYIPEDSRKEPKENNKSVEFGNQLIIDSFSDFVGHYKRSGNKAKEEKTE
jgi:hypothetical protein